MKLHGKLSLLVLLIIAGCGGSGGDMPPTVNEGTGQFIDSAVEGLEYQSGSIRDLTSSDGSFRFEQGSSIRFFIGDIVLGEGTPSDVMSPLNIVAGSPGVTDDHVLNIARFLQTLDTDNDPTNGITISAFARQQAIGKTIDFNVTAAEFAANGNVQTVVSLLTASNDGGPQLLVSADEAEAHLRESLGMEPMPEPNMTWAELREVCWEPQTTAITDEYKSGEVMVGFIDTINQEEARFLFMTYGLNLTSYYASSTGWVSTSVAVPVYSELQWIRTFETLCVVTSANANYVISIPFYPGTGDCSIAC